MTTPPIEYVEARRVLLNVLDALREHLDALVLVGAQAVYLRTEGRLTAYQAFTTDADLVVNLGLLGPTPPLGESLTAAGFEYTGEPGIWNAPVARAGLDQPIDVPVDLIVPEHEAPTAGRRAARLPDRHGKTTARKVAGLEGALIDHAPLDLGALEAHDPRSFTVNIAGPAALLVAKWHKLGERLATPHRLEAKDAGDVYRLYDVVDTRGMARLMGRLLADERSSEATQTGLRYAHELFATETSPGTALAVDALEAVLPPATVATVVTRYTQELLEALPSS